MTAAEHLAKAEQLLSATKIVSGEPWNVTPIEQSVEALTHVCAAIAIELGTPHPPTTAGGGPGA